MTQAARMGSTSTSEAEEARQVELAAPIVRVDGLELVPADAADAAEYVAGRISLDEYGRRTRARYGVPEQDEQGSAGQALDAADAADYAAGRLSLEDYTGRVLARHRGSVQTCGSVDPVAIYDSMREAGTSLMGSYVWLADHAATEDEANRWLAADQELYRERERIDARDEHAQREATKDYVARELALRGLVLA